MKTIQVLLAALLAVSLFLSAGFAAGKNSDGSIKVDGYLKKDGTYVAPANRTAPNKTKNDNWSTKGNVNPYTGKAGTKPRDGGSAGPKRSAGSPSAAQQQTPALPSKSALEAVVRRNTQLLDSYTKAPFGQSPFNAARYEEIRLEREEAQAALNAGRYQ